MCLPCQANGFKVMKQVLEDRYELTDNWAIPIHFSFLNSPIPLKCHKLFQHASGGYDAVSEELERYKLNSDGVSSKFSKQQRIEYTLDLGSWNTSSYCNVGLGGLEGQLDFRH